MRTRARERERERERDDARDDRARDTTAETLVNNFDISPVVRAHDGVVVVDEDDETR